MLRIWIVGGSQGIGLETVRQLLKKGHCVIASARKAESNDQLNTLIEQYPSQLRTLNLDVTDCDNLMGKIHLAWCFFEGLDVWLYNAGAYQPMKLIEADNAQFKLMNEVNYLGCVYLMNEFFKYHQQNHSSKPLLWIWNASLASQFGLPYGGGYSAPKAALVNLAESVQPELSSFGITLRIVNHGFVKTRLTAKNDFEMPGLLGVEEAANRLVRFIENGKGFELSFPFVLVRFLKLLKVMPYRWSLGLTRRLLNS